VAHAGQRRFETLTFDTQTHVVQATLAAANANTPAARLRLEQPSAAKPFGTYTASASWMLEREAYVVPLDATPKLEHRTY